MSKKLHLDADDYIVTAWAEAADGSPGHVPLVKVLVQKPTGRLEVIYTGSDEWPLPVFQIFPFSALASREMHRAVEAAVVRRRAK